MNSEREIVPANPEQAAIEAIRLDLIVDQLALETNIKSETWNGFKEAIGELAEYSPITYAHCLRVGIYAQGLARFEEQPDLHFPLFAGCAHDVGKIGIARSTIEATGKFTDAQQLDIQRHAEIGFNVLKDVHLYSAFVAGLHHKLKPNGYGIDLPQEMPFPLSPESVEKIESMARLIMIVDFFDAMTTRKNDKGLANWGDETAQRAPMLEYFPESQARIDWLFENRQSTVA